MSNFGFLKPDTTQLLQHVLFSHAPHQPDNRHKAQPVAITPLRPPCGDWQRVHSEVEEAFRKSKEIFASGHYYPVDGVSCLSGSR